MSIHVITNKFRRAFGRGAAPFQGFEHLSSLPRASFGPSSELLGRRLPQSRPGCRHPSVDDLERNVSSAGLGWHWTLPTLGPIAILPELPNLSKPRPELVQLLWQLVVQQVPVGLDFQRLPPGAVATSKLANPYTWPIDHEIRRVDVQHIE